jgi:hypothetical protein
VEVDGPGATQARVVQPAQTRELADDERVDRRPHFRTMLSRGGNGEPPAATDEMGEAGGGGGPPAFGDRVRLRCSEGEPSRATGRTLGGVLLERASAAGEARVRFCEGALAGTELHLRAQGAGLVTAELLAVGGESRQTLAAVMDEMRFRLSVKGVALAVTSGGATGNVPPKTGSAATSRHVPGRQPP